MSQSSPWEEVLSRLELKLKEMLQGSADHQSSLQDAQAEGLWPATKYMFSLGVRGQTGLCNRWRKPHTMLLCQWAVPLLRRTPHASATCCQYQRHQAFQYLYSATNERSRLWLSNIGRKWVHLHFACTATEPSSILGPEAPVLYNKHESMIITLVLAASSCSGVRKHGPASFKPGAVGTCHPEPGC